MIPIVYPPFTAIRHDAPPQFTHRYAQLGPPAAAKAPAPRKRCTAAFLLDPRNLDVGVETADGWGVAGEWFG